MIDRDLEDCHPAWRKLYLLRHPPESERWLIVYAIAVGLAASTPAFVAGKLLARVLN